MTTYRKSMSEALNQVRLGEDNMAMMKKAADGSMQTLKMKDGKLKMDSFTASAIMQVYKAVNPKNKKSIEKMINSGSKSQIMKLQSLAMKQIKSSYEEVELDEDGHTDVASAVRKCMTITEDAQDINSKLQTMSTEDSLPSWWTNKLAVASNDMNKMRDYIVNPVQEEVELDEAKYDLYHKDFSSAMQHATKMAKKLHGITIDPKEIDDKVATGPSKPSSGKTNTYRLKGDRGAIQVQVYNKGGSKPFELNMYKEEVELDEAKISVSGFISNSERKKFDDTMKKMRLNFQAVGLGSYKADTSTIRAIAKLAKKMKYKYSMQEEVELDEKIAGLVTKAKKSGMPYGILKKVYDRGMAAYKTGHRPGTTAQQWAFARVNSFTTKSAGTWGKADKDLAKQVRGESVEEEVVEAVSMAQQAAIAISKKERGEKPKKKNEDADLDEASARADAMRAMRRGKTVDPADVDTDATDDDVKSASKNIMMQLRKSVSLRGNFPVEFMDKKKVKIPQKIAQAVLNKHNSFRKPMDKEKFQAKVSKSHKDLLSALKESIAEAGYVGRKDPMPAGKKLAKLMKKKSKNKKENTILDRIDSKLKEKKNG